MRKFLLVALLLLALVRAGDAQTSAGQTPAIGAVPAGATDVRRESFDIVWCTVKEKRFDPHYGGVDWDAVRRRHPARCGG